jgi:hypothetical protein
MKKILIIILAVLLPGCDRELKYPVHQIPPGYEGHVVVIFDQAGFPELPTNRKNQFLPYPVDGILITSSPQRFGINADQAVESSSRVGDLGVRETAKVQQYESWGIRERDGIKMPFLVKAVGSGAFWSLHNPTDYAAKVDEAEQKLRRGLNLSEQASTEQPATSPESKSEGSDKTQPEAEGRSR